VPGYLLAGGLTALVENPGDRVILRAYLTALFTDGVALCALALVIFAWAKGLRHASAQAPDLGVRDAALLALATTSPHPFGPMPPCSPPTPGCLAALAPLPCSMRNIL